MIPWGLTPARLGILAAVALAVCVASAAAGYRLGVKVGTSEGNAKVVKMLEAGQAAVNRRQAENDQLRGKAREDAQRIADLSRDVRVRCYTDRPGVPAARPDADPPGGRGEAGTDATDVLRQCLRTFGEVNRALRGGG